MGLIIITPRLELGGDAQSLFVGPGEDGVWGMINRFDTACKKCTTTYNSRKTIWNKTSTNVWGAACSQRA
jgi:hypothetical protein